MMLTVIAVALSGIACFETTGDEYTVKVICTGGDVTGYVMPDDGNVYFFDADLVATNTYMYQGSFEDIETLYVSATIAGGVSANVAVFIFLNDEQVGEASLSVTSSDTTRTVTLSYTGDTTDTTTEE